MPHQFQTDDRGNLLHFAVANASSHMQGDHQDVSLCLRQLLPHMKLEIDKLDENGEVHSYLSMAFVCIIICNVNLHLCTVPFPPLGLTLTLSQPQPKP